MFPLRDVHRPAKTPWLTRLLIATNIGAFLWQWGMWTLRGAAVEARLGVTPLCYASPGSCGIALPNDAERLWQPLFASLFLHGDWLHLGFNMLFLSVFGGAVEDKLGKTRFFCLYFGCGIAATLAHVLTHPFSASPVIGASGAIAGILGAYFILLPRSWILTYLPPIWFFFPVPAPLFLILWLGAQLSGAFTALAARFPFLAPQSDATQAVQIAWMAHLGGFLVGAMAGWSVKTVVENGEKEAFVGAQAVAPL